MTESLFPFGSADAPAAQAEPEASSSRRPLLLLGGGLVVAAGAAAVLLLGGGSEDSTELVPITAVARAPKAAAAPAAPAAPQALPAEHNEDIARNPFEAKYVAPKAAPPAPPVPAVVPLPAPAALPLDPGGAGTQGGGGSLARPVVLPPEEEPPAAEYPITLEAVGDAEPEVRTLTWTVDGQKVDVIPGQRFGRHGELVVLAYTTKEGSGEVTGAVLQVGDAAPLAVSIGETVEVL